MGIRGQGGGAVAVVAGRGGPIGLVLLLLSVQVQRLDPRTVFPVMWVDRPLAGTIITLATLSGWPARFSMSACADAPAGSEEVGVDARRQTRLGTGGRTS